MEAIYLPVPKLLKEQTLGSEKLAGVLGDILSSVLLKFIQALGSPQRLTQPTVGLLGSH